MNCSRVTELFIDYQDGTLPPDEAAQMRAHLASCPTCQREWSALQEITRKLDQLPSPEPSARLRENFYAMLETHQRDADAPSPFALAKSRLDRFFELLLPRSPRCSSPSPSPCSRAASSPARTSCARPPSSRPTRRPSRKSPISAPR
ncbi:anti-sigma factor family protein [Oleiharenicola sp. Vm1]|uniref:anti-sigma factor family protein n=1 Tax=Oleiharenicola sp. Vm1 TaxID=3398393 RepID=UPI0039F52506